jgi:hypothetical protein
LKLCTSCDAQFPEEHTHCIHCGRSLAPPREAATSGPDGPAVPDDMVLYRKREPIYAPPLLDALRAADVRFLAVGDLGTGGYKGESGSSGHDSMIEIYVDHLHLERAHVVETQLLRRTLPALSGSPEPPPMRGDHCPACDATLADDQMTCPDCGLRFG